MAGTTVAGPKRTTVGHEIMVNGTTKAGRMTVRITVAGTSVARTTLARTQVAEATVGVVTVADTNGGLILDDKNKCEIG